MDRRTYIGGSAVAGVLGIAPPAWNITPLSLYERMISDEPEPPISDEKRKFFARRKRQEPVVAEMLADEYGIEVTRLSMDENPNRYVDPHLPYLAAEVDFEFPLTQAVKDRFPERLDIQAIPNGTTVNGEIKTVHPFSARDWGEHGSEEVPTYYAAQVMHGLGVTGRPLGFVAALFGLDVLSCFPVLADQDTIDGMRSECSLFWNRVQRRDPPPPLTLDEHTSLLTRLRGRPVELNDDAIKAFRFIIESRATINGLKKPIEDATILLAEFVTHAWGADSDRQLDDAVLMRNGVVVGTWKRQRGSFLDQKAMRAGLGGVIAKRLRGEIGQDGSVKCGPGRFVEIVERETGDLISAFDVEHYFRVLRGVK